MKKIEPGMLCRIVPVKGFAELHTGRLVVVQPEQAAMLTLLHGVMTYWRVNSVDGPCSVRATLGSDAKTSAWLFWVIEEALEPIDPPPPETVDVDQHTPTTA